MKTIEELKKDKILKNHNISTYLEMLSQFESGASRVGIVQATGTGKSYLAMQWLFDMVLSQKGKQALVLTPLKGIVRQFKKVCERICREHEIYPHGIPILFSNYDRLKTLTDDEIRLLDYDYIVLDEFHGLGAEGRGSVVQKLLAANPNAKVMGITATPIRYLDKNRDMGDELFGDNLVQGVNLGEAIRTGILPKPIYEMAIYSYGEILNDIKSKIQKNKNKKEREEFESELALIEEDYEKAKRKAETANGLQDDFARAVRSKSGKYIAFCANTEKMDSIEAEIQAGLLNGVNKNIKIYKISYRDSDSKANEIIRQFEEDKSDCLKVMLAVDMFNEGIHVKDVDGVFLFRPTVSPRIYTQQIGRCLSVRDDRTFGPLIFDVVNNIRCMDQIKAAFEAEKIGKCGGRERNGTENFEVPFTIHMQGEDFYNRVRDFDNRVSQSLVTTRQWLAAAERYVKANDNLNVPQRYIEEPTELRLGSWICNIRIKFNTNPTLVKSEIAEKLTILDENWVEYTADNEIEQRDKKIIDGVSAWTKDKSIPNSVTSPVDKDFPLGMHIAAIKNQINGVRKGHSYSQELIDQINKINPAALWTQEDLNKQRDKKIIDGVTAWRKRGPIPKGEPSPVDKEFPLGAHIVNIKAQIRGTRKGHTYSQELIDQINEINSTVLWTQEDLNKQRDEKILAGVTAWGKREPIPQREPSPVDKEFLLGVYIANIKAQIRGTREGQVYSQELIDQINEINPCVLQISPKNNKPDDESE